ncbi:hypothetical protein FOA52_009261 [Chlamydomonas sp. UWO 241]|nr:hypothetical protein FOA52_009261 [Chlamydomonas sp. UWO 241]
MAMKQVVSGSRTRVVARAQPTKAAVPRKALAAGIAIPAFVYAAPALAEEAGVQVQEVGGADQVDSAISQLVEAVKSSGDIVRSGISALDTGVKLAGEQYETARPYLESGFKTAVPLAQQAIDAVSEAAKPLISQATPYVSSLEASLKDPTVTTAVATGQQAITAATPVAQKVINFLTTAEPETLGEIGLGVAAAYYLAPPLFGAFLGSLKGFAGEMSASMVLDSLTADGSCVLVDIRAPKEKESSGVPDVPSSVSRRALEVEFATTEDRKLRGSLRDPTAIEAAVTALQIAALKNVSKGSKIILLDRYGGQATTVAKELASKGFGKVYIVAGGFDGRNGWVQSKLQIKPAASIMNAPAPGAKFGTLNFKNLPAPRA